jgi:hypothetical protein
MKAVAELTSIDSSAATITGGTFTKSFTLNTYAVTLLTIRDKNVVAAIPQTNTPAARTGLSAVCRGDAFIIALPGKGQYEVQLSSMDGRTALRARVSGGSFMCAKNAFAPGAYVVRAVPSIANGAETAELRMIAVVK